MFIRLCILVGALLLFQVIAYFGAELIEGKPHNVKRRIDDRIPVIPWTGIIYVTWFPLIVLSPFIYYYADIDIFITYILAWFIDVLLSAVTYLVYPTGFERPETDSIILKVLYSASFKQINCSPSLHCSLSYIVILACAFSENIHQVIVFVMIADALAICASTLFTKQHVITDVVTAVPYAAVSWMISMLISGNGLVHDFIIKILLNA